MGELLDQLPYICLANQEIWRTMSPLICFEIAEWHRPERVLRQFGMHQEIPPACSYEQQLHAVDARGRHQRDWTTYHAPYIALWETRAARIITSPPMVGLMDFHDPYMQWYRRITRRFMTPRLHRDDMRFHTTAGSIKSCVSKIFYLILINRLCSYNSFFGSLRSSPWLT